MSPSARAALDAADSGHVFLSTLHPRDAAGTLSVLHHFGLTDHEIAASVDLLVAQRLVRQLCPACRRPEPPTPGEAEWLRHCGQPVPDKTWRAADCPKCGGSGYRGRVGVFEIHRLGEADADLILAHADEHTLRDTCAGVGRFPSSMMICKKSPKAPRASRNFKWSTGWASSPVVVPQKPDQASTPRFRRDALFTDLVSYFRLPVE